MTTERQNSYTDAPQLSRSILLGSGRLLFWLFFHPSAWRNHLAQIDATLSPDFCLIETTHFQWKRPSFWRFLLMTAIAWPLLAVLTVVATLLLLNVPGEGILLGVSLGIAFGLVSSLIVALVGSVASATAIGTAVTLVVGILSSLILGTAPQLPTLPFDLTLATLLGLSGGLAGGLAYGVALGIATSPTIPNPATSLARQISGVILGLFIGGLGGFAISTFRQTWLTGLLLGVAFMLALRLLSRQWPVAITGGLLVGIGGTLITNTISLSESRAFLGSIGLLAMAAALFALPYVLAERIAGAWAGALAGALGACGGLYFFLLPDGDIASLALFMVSGVLLGLTLAWWRPVLAYPFLMAWNMLLLRLDEGRAARPSPYPLFQYHSAFWDELQRLPLVGLDNYLLLVMHHWPEEGEAALAYLAASHQRWAAQAAQIELDAQQLAACDTPAAIGQAHHILSAGELAGPASALLRTFSRLSQDTDAASRQESVYNQRLAFSAVEDRLDSLLRELTRSQDTYAIRFRPIAEQWRHIIATSVRQLAAEAEQRQEIDSPYVIGVPLTDKQEIFIGRTDISARIEQLLLDRRQPPLLLYGQRRVGKTSLLNNLGRLLPSTIVPLFVDLQGPASRAVDNAGFLYNVARSMIRSAEQQRHLILPPLTREALVADPFTRFEEWLDEVSVTLEPGLALLMLDEFEVLATAVANHRFDAEAVMGMLRHLIQHKPRFKVLLSGSHTLDEFEQWASYLINVQVIHMSYLRPEEARQLVEAPVTNFALRYEPAASKQVVWLTRGHPFLVQLLCAEIVALKNEQPPTQRRLATAADVETAVPRALAHGALFFADIAKNQVNDTEREVLHMMAAHQEAVVSRQALVDYIPSLMALEQALVRLQNRELIEQVAGGYRFQVPLVRHWFQERPGW
ncbi:MAG: hypothetical protein Kow0080_11000 [Candidatus Promineifilaceae bacterium]